MPGHRGPGRCRSPREWRVRSARAVPAAGSPESAKAHLVERITKGAGGRITDVTTVDDPVMYAHPFSYQEHWFYQPVDGDFDEEVCENDIDTTGTGPLVPPP